LKYSGAPSAVRSAGWTAYQASLDTMQQYHDDLYTLLTAYAADLFPNPAITVPDYHTNNLSRNAVKTAIKMLKAPGSLLKHVAVVDGGVEADYDTHKPPPAGTIAAGRVEIVQNGNIWNICDTLANNLNAILDNNIVVLIHSEFGRREETPDDGTEHHMPGYTNVVIGDVITNPGFTGEASGADGSVAAMIATAAGHPFSPIAWPTDRPQPDRRPRRRGRLRRYRSLASRHVRGRPRQIPHARGGLRRDPPGRVLRRACHVAQPISFEEIFHAQARGSLAPRPPLRGAPRPVHAR
jgi:hypothetical protein